MKVIAVDPGKTTGIALWGWDEFRSLEIPGGLHPASAWVDTHLRQEDVLVIENFVISSSTIRKELTEVYTTLYIVGALKDLAYRKGARVVDHRPPDKEWGLRFLESVGWYKAGLGGHANVAAAHLLKYLADTQQLGRLLPAIIDAEIA